ncbi:MAG: nuclear transport factor 2 family protein [Ignavibacteriae bacterium]|nr:nuclear transport factor 2 family protein [Ignavibacteriota bacterium]
MDTTLQIEKELRKYYDSFQHKNWVEFADFLANDFKYYTDKCTIQNKQEFVGFLEQDDWRVLEYSISNIHTILSEGKDLAVVYYTIVFTGISSNQNVALKAIETTVFVLTNDKWKIQHCHTSNL